MSESDFDRKTNEIIDRVGWTVIKVAPREGDEGGTFSYTVGLTAQGLPEIAVAGLDLDTMHAMLNDVAHRARAGVTLFHGQRLSDVIEGYDIILVDGTSAIDRDSIWPGVALERYGPSVRLFQLVWPDKSGHFPWEDKYNLPDSIQLVLSTP